MFHKYFALFCVIMMLLTACGKASIPPTAVSTTVQPTSTPKVITTPNIYLLAYELIDQYGNFEIVNTEDGIQQAVFTNGPTFNLVGGTLVEIAQIKQDEHDLHPRYVMEIEQEYLDVLIKGSLITDSTLPADAKIVVSESTFAQFISRVIFWAWWANGTAEKHTGMAAEEDYYNFMTLWGMAQKSNSPTDWKKVEFTAWANDLNDGKGYVQEKMTFWPMHSGVTPEGVVNITQISIAVLDGTMVKNVDIVSKDYTLANGTNLDEEHLYLYEGQPMEIGFYALLAKNVASGLSGLPYWLGRTGNTSNNVPENKALKNLLLNGGLETGVVGE